RVSLPDAAKYDDGQQSSDDDLLQHSYSIHGAQGERPVLLELLGLLGGLDRIFEGYDFSLLQTALHNNVGFIPLADFDRADHEILTILHPNRWLLVVEKAGSR